MSYFQRPTWCGGDNSPVKQFQNSTQASRAICRLSPRAANCPSRVPSWFKKEYRQRLYVPLSLEKTKPNLDGKQRVKSQRRHENGVQILKEEDSNTTEQFHTIASVSVWAKIFVQLAPDSGQIYGSVTHRLIDLPLSPSRSEEPHSGL